MNPILSLLLSLFSIVTPPLKAQHIKEVLHGKVLSGKELHVELYEYVVAFFLPKLIQKTQKSNIPNKKFNFRFFSFFILYF